VGRQAVSGSAERPSSVRVAGVNWALRWYSFLATVFAGVILWPKGGTSVFDLGGPLVALSLVAPTLMLLIALRSIFMGVWLFGDKVVARTLFRKLTVARSDLESCTTTSATITPTSASGVFWLRELVLTLANDRHHRLWGSVALANRSELQAKQIRAYIRGVATEQTLDSARSEA